VQRGLIRLQIVSIVNQVEREMLIKDKVLEGGRV
jgi:hypothetical protein